MLNHFQSKRRRASQKEDELSTSAHPRTKQKKVAPDFSNPSDTVTFTVGPKAEKFVVHKDFVCHYSPVLSAAFNSEFIEGQTANFEVKDCTPRAFRGFVQWLYTKKFDLPLDKYLSPADYKDPGFPCIRDRAKAKQDTDHVQLWILGGMWLMPILQNDIMAALGLMLGIGCVAMFASTVQYIYDNTGKDCPLRHLVVDHYAYDRDLSKINSFSKDFPPAFILDITVLLNRRLINGRASRPPHGEIRLGTPHQRQDYNEIVKRDYRVAVSNEQKMGHT